MRYNRGMDLMSERASTSTENVVPIYSVAKPRHRQAAPTRKVSPEIADDLFARGFDVGDIAPRSLDDAGRSGTTKANASTASVIVFAFALSGIVLIFLLFYFLARVCSPNGEDDWKDIEKAAPLNITEPKVVQRKEAMGVHDSPRHVLYPRRIYELQAEEGCYSSLPTMSSEQPDDTVVILKANGGVETKRRVQRGRSFRQIMRKLTTSSMQLNMNLVGFRPRDSLSSECSGQMSLPM